MDCSLPGSSDLHYLLEFVRFMSIESVMLSKHLILCLPFLLLPSIFPSIRVFSSELSLHIRWPKYWSFSFGISPSNQYTGFISFKIDQFDVPAVQGTLKSLFQHYSSKANWNRMFLTTSWDGGSHRIILDWEGKRWHLLHTDVDSNSCITCVKWPNCSHQEYEHNVGAFFREQLISTLSTLDVTLRACVRGIQTDCRRRGFRAFLSADSWCSSLSITAIWDRNWCREQYR